MQTLRNVVAATIHVSNEKEAFVPASLNPKSNTPIRVQEFLTKNATPIFDPYFWDLADEAILYFATLKKTPRYKQLQKDKDAALYEACINAAAKEEVDVIDFQFAVMIPHLYYKLNPKPPVEQLKPDKTEAKIYASGQFLGVIGVPERFFMKLIQVTSEQKLAGGNMFVLMDRSGNKGSFYDKANRWDETIQLGDCFHFHAIPQKHATLTDNTNMTLFRNAQFVESAGPSASLPPVTEDLSDGHLFTKGRIR